MRNARWLLVVTVGLLGACSVAPGTDATSQTTFPRGGATVAQSTTSADDYEVVLDVAYQESLRVPGTGYLLRELSLEYSLTSVVRVGEPFDPQPIGTAEWTVRCYADQFSPEQEPTAVSSGNHQAIFEWTRDDLRGSESLEESGVDWTSGPETVLVDAGSVIQVVHRLPSAIALDDTIGCDGESSYSAIALARGHAAMVAPGRVVTDAGAFSVADALNTAAGETRYLLDSAASGWVVDELPPAELGGAATVFSMSFEAGPDPEGGQVLTITGSIRRID